MDMLDWARGPLFYAASTVFVLGVAWRLFAFVRLPATPEPAPARKPFGKRDAFRAALIRMWPRRGMAGSATLVTFNPYVFHIGLALIVFGYAPHIAFIRYLTGLGWPALPDFVMYLSAAAFLPGAAFGAAAALAQPLLPPRACASGGLGSDERQDSIGPGTHTVFATWDGVTRSQQVRVGNSPARAVLYWPGFEVEGRVPPANAM